MAIGRPQTHAEGLEKCLSEWIRYAIHTALPGIIDTFDLTTRRARVRIAIEALDQDDKCFEAAPLLNVPVIFPAGAGGMLLFELQRGDSVWIMFSERGLQTWKEKFELSPPYPVHFFSQSDAVALPGFGPSGNASPVQDTGIMMQTQNGDLSVRITENKIVLDVPDGMEIQIGDGEATSKLLTDAFLAMFNSHTHTESGGDPTSTPVSAIPITGTHVTEKTKAS